MTNQDTEILTEIAFLDKLRAATANAHTQLELLPVSTAIVSPQITMKAYGDYLNLMHDIIRDTEMHVFPLLSDMVPDMEQRRKLALITADLHQIDRKIKPRATKLDDAFTIPFAFGIMYVVEGSSLGGRFIVKNVETVLGLIPDCGAQYFSGYGNHTGSFWKNFLAILTQYEHEQHCGNEMIAGADFAFKTIYNHFSTLENEN